MNLDYLVIHCSDTPEGREVSREELESWHKGPLDQSDGTVVYLGKKYIDRDHLPNDMLNGHPVKNITGRGWDRFGYSDFLHIDGSLENLTPYNQDNNVDSWEITWGATGINSRARHMCYVGGLREEVVDGHYEPADTRTKAQLYSMEVYVRYMILRHPNIKVAGHRDFANKACPCFNVQDWLVSIGIDEKNIYRKDAKK